MKMWQVINKYTKLKFLYSEENVIIVSISHITHHHVNQWYQVAILEKVLSLKKGHIHDSMHSYFQKRTYNIHDCLHSYFQQLKEPNLNTINS